MLCAAPVVNCAPLGSGVTNNLSSSLSSSGGGSSLALETTNGDGGQHCSASWCGTYDGVLGVKKIPSSSSPKGCITLASGRGSVKLATKSSSFLRNSPSALQTAHPFVRLRLRLLAPKSAEVSVVICKLVLYHFSKCVHRSSCIRICAGLQSLHALFQLLFSISQPRRFKHFLSSFFFLFSSSSLRFPSSIKARSSLMGVGKGSSGLRGSSAAWSLDTPLEISCSSLPWFRHSSCSFRRSFS